MNDLNEIFYYDNTYSQKVEFCEKNNYRIKEIEPDAHGRRFQIQNTPSQTEEQLIMILRHKREDICFSVINRGRLWYDSLNQNQLEELDRWYKQWLNVTITKTIPETPLWIK